MNNITLILLTAGNASRFAMSSKKQWLYQGDIPLWLKVVRDFETIGTFRDIVIVGHPQEISYMKNFCDYKIIEGGSSRQESLANAIKIIDSEYILVNDIARCCIDKDMINRVLSKRGEADCIVPAIKAVDTVYYEDKPIDRDKIRLIQTPQLSRREILIKAFENGGFTDESSAIRAIGGSVLFVEGSQKAKKLTTIDDLNHLDCLKKPDNTIQTGYGIDIHAFEKDKKMKLCGVEIESEFGFKAHSDGDVAIHSLIDALLGAAGMGDIGEHFPDTDSQYKNADSIELLKSVVDKIYSCGLDIVNIDLTILAQTPKISPYKNKMRKKISKILNISPSKVNIKATTAENMGFVGRKEGVTVYAVANIKPFDWSDIV